MDVLSHLRKKRKGNNKLLKRRKCDQPWLASFAYNISRTLFHKKICLYLGLPLGISINDMYKYESGTRKQAIKISTENAEPTADGKPSEGENPSSIKLLFAKVICYQDLKYCC